jgi:hypothetical protein
MAWLAYRLRINSREGCWIFHLERWTSPNHSDRDAYDILDGKGEGWLVEYWLVGALLGLVYLILISVAASVTQFDRSL